MFSMFNRFFERALRLVFLGSVFLLLTGYSSCDPVIKNNGFNLWCGDDTLCDWELEAGSIRPAPTWHDADKGIELGAGKVSLSQVSDISASNTQCIRFDIVADVKGAAEVALELDYFDDGVVDVERTVPGTDWQPSSYLIELPPNYQGIRFRIRKDGSGTVVIAQLQAEVSEECEVTPETPVPAPLGAFCSSADQCASGLCHAFVCAECDPGASAEDDTYCPSCGEVVPESSVLSPYAGCEL